MIGDSDILEMISSDYTWKKIVSYYWYYDIKNWKRSITGKENEVPLVPMVQSEIDWVTKHYIPKARKYYGE